LRVYGPNVTGEEGTSATEANRVEDVLQSLVGLVYR
jgi:hypothetical protein